MLGILSKTGGFVLRFAPFQDRRWVKSELNIVNINKWSNIEVQLESKPDQIIGVNFAFKLIT